MPARRLSMLVACCALAAASACSSTGKAAVSPEPTISVGRTALPSAGVSTVAQALRAAGVVVPRGRVLAIRSRRPLGLDTQLGRVLVDGRPTLPAAAISPGAVITVERGADVTEPVEAVTLPDQQGRAIASLRVGARAGSVRVTRGRLSHEVLRQVPLTSGSVGRLVNPRPLALTFDDGPNATYTPRLLAILARDHVHATFCLVGRLAEKHPDLVKAIVAGGHTLCNHSWDHNEQLNHLTRAQILAEMTKAQAAITKASGGVVPELFRAPGGAWSAQVEALAHSVHLTPLKWNVDPRDWARPGVPHIEGVVLATVHPGSIVLMHDGGGNRDQTMTAVAFLIPKLRAAHYTFWKPFPVSMT